MFLVSIPETELSLGSVATLDEASSDVAATQGGGFAVSYLASSRSGPASVGVKSQTFDITGLVLAGSSSAIGGAIKGSTAIAGLPDGQSVVAWLGADFTVYQQAISADGRSAAPMRVSQSAVDDKSGIDMSVIGRNHTVVTWTTAQAGSTEQDIKFRIHDEAGTALTGEQIANSATAGSQDHSTTTPLSDGGFLIAWVSAEAGSDLANIQAQRFDRDGNVTGAAFTVGSAAIGGTTDVVQLANGNLEFVWQAKHAPIVSTASTLGLVMRQFTIDGTAAGPETAISPSADFNHSLPQIAALPDGGFAAIWQAQGQDGMDGGIYAQFFDMTGKALKTLPTLINTQTVGDQTAPSAAVLANGDIITTWTSKLPIGFPGAPDSGKDIVGKIIEINYAPVLKQPVMDFSSNSGETFIFTVPNGTFVNLDAVDMLDFRAKLANGSALPSWITFNPATLQFSGTSPSGSDTKIDIQLTASDQGLLAGSLSASDVFSMNFAAVNHIPLISGDMSGRVDLASSVISGRLHIEDGDVGQSVFSPQTNADVKFGQFSLDEIGNWSYMLNTNLSAVQSLDAKEFIAEELRVLSADGSDVVLTVFIDGSGKAPNFVTVRGSGRAEKLLASSDDDMINGKGGADRIFAGAGNDVIVGGAGADSIHGGAGIDTASYFSSHASVTVSLQKIHAKPVPGSGGQAEGDRLHGIENLTGSNFADTLIGNKFSNWLVGQGGSDLLKGMGGGDHLDGGAGKDTLIGSVHASDVFVFRDGYGRDTITKFEDHAGSQDVIEIQSSLAADFSALQAMMVQAGEDVRIQFGGGDQLILRNTFLENLSSDDFIIM
jgi:VCBS repeat-containing protein